MPDHKQNEETQDLFSNDVEIQWCPGCPNFSILEALKTALMELGERPHEMCLISGIGQAAKLPHYLKCNFFNGLHGRALPVATGIQAANPELTTLVVTGDGDCYGEGGNHFIHALRRNPNITVMVHNNEIYALTKGQASPTTEKGERRSIQKEGVQVEPLNALGLAILHHCTFVARGFAADKDGLSKLLAAAIQHEGFSYVDIIQPCITWGTHPLSWYRERVKPLPEDHDPKDQMAALHMAMGAQYRFSIGILYQIAPREVFGAGFREAVTDQPLGQPPPLSAKRIEAMLQPFQP